MGRIVTVHFPDLKRDVVRACVEAFYRLRGIDGIEKKPATRELLNWIRALRADPGFTVSGLQKGDVPCSNPRGRDGQKGHEGGEERLFLFSPSLKSESREGLPSGCDMYQYFHPGSKAFF